MRMLDTFPKGFSQAATTSPGYFPKWQFSKCAIPHAATSQVHSSRSARPPSPYYTQRLAPIAACVASEGFIPNLWEVAAWEISHLGSCHLGNCHVGSHPCENAFGKIPNTKMSIHKSQTFSACASL